MPTGYTAGILDDTITTFEEYAKRCARAFGGFIHMRDESLDAPLQLPEELNETTYHDQQLINSINEIIKINSSTDQELIDTYIKNKENSLLDSTEQYKKALSNRRKLEKILKEVESWEIPNEEFENYKQFMISQLKDTIEFDGDHMYYHNEMIRIQEEIENTPPIEEIRNILLSGHLWSKEYHTKKLNKMKNKTKNTFSWGKTLIESVEQYQKQLDAKE